MRVPCFFGVLDGKSKSCVIDATKCLQCLHGLEWNTTTISKKHLKKTCSEQHSWQWLVIHSVWDTHIHKLQNANIWFTFFPFNHKSSRSKSYESRRGLLDLRPARLLHVAKISTSWRAILRQVHQQAQVLYQLVVLSRFQYHHAGKHNGRKKFHHICSKTTSYLGDCNDRSEEPQAPNDCREDQPWWTEIVTKCDNAETWWERIQKKKNLTLSNGIQDMRRIQRWVVRATHEIGIKSKIKMRSCRNEAMRVCVLALRVMTIRGLPDGIWPWTSPGQS